MNDEYRCTCGHAVYSHSTRDDTSHCLAIDCECYAYQADSYAAGVAAEKARAIEIIQLQLARDFMVGETAYRDLLKILDDVRDGVSP